jgi:hypothetical protein
MGVQYSKQLQQQKNANAFHESPGKRYTCFKNSAHASNVSRKRCACSSWLTIMLNQEIDNRMRCQQRFDTCKYSRINSIADENSLTFRPKVISCFYLSRPQFYLLFDSTQWDCLSRSSLPYSTIRLLCFVRSCSLSLLLVAASLGLVDKKRETRRARKNYPPFRFLYTATTSVTVVYYYLRNQSRSVL